MASSFSAVSAQCDPATAVVTKYGQTDAELPAPAAKRYRINAEPAATWTSSSSPPANNVAISSVWRRGKAPWIGGDISTGPTMKVKHLVRLRTESRTH